MPSININIKDLDKAIGKLNSIPKEAENVINNEFKAFGLATAGDAKRLAPVDEGYLRNHISAVNENLKVSIVVNAVYAAYQEFGTKAFAAAYVSSLPATWQEFAVQFQGSAKGFKDFFTAIMDWVKRKGIDESAAYPIARKILREGVKPHPYLIPAFEKNKIDLINHLKEQFK